MVDYLNDRYPGLQIGLRINPYFEAQDNPEKYFPFGVLSKILDGTASISKVEDIDYVDFTLNYQSCVVLYKLNHGVDGDPAEVFDACWEWINFETIAATFAGSSSQLVVSDFGLANTQYPYNSMAWCFEQGSAHQFGGWVVWEYRANDPDGNGGVRRSHDDVDEHGNGCVGNNDNCWYDGRIDLVEEYAHDAVPYLDASN